VVVTAMIGQENLLFWIPNAKLSSCRIFPKYHLRKMKKVRKNNEKNTLFDV
jgi:hypothetical protein